MLRRSTERIQRIRAVAQRLAQSGNYANWQEVQEALRTKWPEVEDALNHDFTRVLIDTACSSAMRK